MTTVFVAGGAGLLGSAIARRLLDTGATVLVADCFDDSGDGSAVKNERMAPFEGHPRAAVLRVNLTDAVETERVFAEERPAAVISAARFDPSQGGVGTLAAVARASGTGLFVHLSDGALYGPSPEEGRHAKEDEPIDAGEDPMLRLKASEEEILLSSGTPAVILRVFSVIGPGFPPSRFPAEALEAILGDEEVFLPDDEARDYVHIDDVARAVELALLRRPSGHVVNLGSGAAARPSAIVARLAERAGKSFTLRVVPSPLSPPRACRVADLERAWELLGYSPQRGLDEAAAEIVAARLNPHLPLPRPAARFDPPSASPLEPPREVSRRELFDMFRRPFKGR